MNADHIEAMGQKLMAEAKDKARARAESIFGPVPAGSTDMGRKAFLEMARRMWADPAFRQNLLTQMGPVNFRDLVIELHGGNEAVWPLPGKDIPLKQPPIGAAPPMSDFQAQSLQNQEARLALLARQGG